jgi:regulator of protease activity HflC (stomatin/prohibitin superfamily)
LKTQRLEAEAKAAAQKLLAESEAETQRIQTEADILALRERAQAAEAYTSHPAMLRLRELDTLRELAQTANARIYIGFDKHTQPSGAAANGEQEK